MLILYRTCDMQSAVLLSFVTSSSLPPCGLQSTHSPMTCYISLYVVYNLVYTSAPFTCYAVRMRRVFGAQLINFPWTWGEQRTSGAWKGHPAHPVLFVFVQKTDKFRFAANGMRTVRGWRTAGSQSHPHIRAFGTPTVRESFGALVYTRFIMSMFYTVTQWEVQAYHFPKIKKISQRLLVLET